MPALQSLLSPQVLTKVISQKAKTSDWLINLYGVGPGGKNEVYEGHGRQGAFHIFNHTRKVALGRAPGTAAGRSAANPMGQVLFTYPRMHDSLSLSAEILHNLGKISDPAVRDKSGADMIARQTDYLAEKSANWRKAQFIGMLRDSLYYTIDGDDVKFNYSGTGNQISFQMPAGNKAQLDMLGEGSIINTTWANADADIPDHLGKINRAFQRLCGGRLAGALITHQIFNYIRKNNVVQEEHGTSVSPYLRYEVLDVETSPGQTMKNVLVVELKSFPGCTFYVTDEVIDLGYDSSESLQPIVPANSAIFMGHAPGDSVIQCYQGSEPIAEYDGAPETEKIGFAAWSVKRSNPTSTELYTLDNALIVNHIPTANAIGTVVF